MSQEWVIFFRKKQKIGARVLYYTGVSAILYSFFSHTATSVFEQKMLSSDLTLKLAYKYNFTLFDFAQAKKESHLKSMRLKLLDENFISIAYTTPE